ncbi:MAG: hypothetical protein HOB42_12390 [Candidatus Marinimicrobia bacterium]|jgi:hypothetical protein|nr:hypothetical protein [Candidatus Neomarinimicrobiota bacterium]MBT6638755.1 hypothetical protein [Candidatus Neomarinimicrobiota bacterium]
MINLKQYSLYGIMTIVIFGCTNFEMSKPEPSHIPPAEVNYRKHFLTNKSTLNPIEGVWMEYVVGTLYEDGKVVERKEVPKRARWIVIKKGNVFKIFNEYGEQNKYVASFKQGRQKDTYTFDCYFIKSKDHIITKVLMVDGKRIEMAYDAPKGIFEENYQEFMGKALKHDPEKTLELHWQFNWLKTFPK